MDEVRIGQLTKEMVAEELRRLGDPCAAAAAVVRKTLAAAFDGPAASGGVPVELAVEDAVKGAMTALLLADHNLARGAILVLESVVDVSAERQLDPTAAMTAALKGLADLRRFVEPERIDDIRLEIEAHYHGAGEVFSGCLREPLKAR
jgi:hypothetical protein